MPNRRVGGIIFIKVDSAIQQAKGSFSYNLGQPKREAVVGQDKVHGYKEEPQVAMIEGALTDNDELDLEALVLTKDATITLELANGKIIVLRDGFYAADGNVDTNEGEIEVRFESATGPAEEVR